MPMTWCDVLPEQLKEPPLITEEFFTALKEAKHSVGPEEIKEV